MRISLSSVSVILLFPKSSAFVSPLLAKSAVKDKSVKNGKNALADKKSAVTLKPFGGKNSVKAAPTSKKVKDVVSLKSPTTEWKLPLLGNIKVPELPNISLPGAPELPNLPSLTVPDLPVVSPVGIAGVAMGSLSPLFALEAKIQAGVLVNVVDFLGAPLRVYPDEIRAETKKRVSSTKPILYTYGLSPFSGEAKKILEPYDVEIFEIGPEWFLLGPGASEKRLALAENSPNLQTSLPHLFLKGESLGGLSTGGRDNSGIIGLEKSGELEKLLKKKSSPKKTVGKKIASRKVRGKKVISSRQGTKNTQSKRK